MLSGENKIGWFWLLFDVHKLGLVSMGNSILSVKQIWQYPRLLYKHSMMKNLITLKKKKIKFNIVPLVKRIHFIPIWTEWENYSQIQPFVWGNSIRQKYILLSVQSQELIRHYIFLLE